MALLDLRGRCTEVNDRLCELVGYRREEMLGNKCTDLLYSGEPAPVEALYTDLREGRVESGYLELCLRHQDGHPFWMFTRLGAVRGADDQPIYLVGQYEALGSDGQISAERLAELTRMALHDPLTGLANRALLTDRFDQALSTLSERGAMLALLVIDIDEFKAINDRHGHHAGDQILQAAAHELCSCVRAGDTVARLGGDEFVVLAHAANHAQADAVRTRITQRLNTSTVNADQPIQFSASVGLATTRAPSTHFRALLASADRNMYAGRPRTSSAP